MFHKNNPFFFKVTVCGPLLIKWSACMSVCCNGQGYISHISLGKYSAYFLSHGSVNLVLNKRRYRNVPGPEVFDFFYTLNASFMSFFSIFLVCRQFLGIRKSNPIPIIYPSIVNFVPFSIKFVWFHTVIFFAFFKGILSRKMRTLYYIKRFRYQMIVILIQILCSHMEWIFR